MEGGGTRLREGAATAITSAQESIVMRAVTLRAVALCGVLSASAWGDGEMFTLVPGSDLWSAEPQCIVVNRPVAGYLERWAAREFVGYVHRASESRVLLPQAMDAVPEGWAGSAVVVGGAGEPPFEDQDPARMPAHGFRIWTAPGRLNIAGASEQGASNALFWLLREKLGVRWLMPTALGEEVPVLQQIAFEPLDVTLGPDIPAGNFDPCYFGIKGNRSPSGMRRDHNSRHIWDEIVRPTDENRRDHPEWFALTDRTEMPAEDWVTWLWRDADGHIRSNQVCTTEPAVLDIFVSAARRFFREEPQATMFSVEPNDYHDFCTCERCRALDEQLGNGPLMNRLVFFFNQIAAALKDEFPDRQLGFYAYSSHVDPPITVTPDPMLVPTLCFFGSRACYAHDIADPDCEINVAWKQSVFDPWTALCPRFGFYGYYAYSGAWQGPQMMLRTLPEDLRLVRERGGYYVHVAGWRNWATCAPMLYLLSAMLWDVDADPRKLLDEWYALTYGPASEPMKAYWETLERGYYQDGHTISKPDAPERMFTPEIIAAARAQMNAAEEAVAGAPDRYRRRVAIARAGLAYTDAMALGYACAADGRFGEAAEAGRRALETIVGSRALEPAPYITPLWPRDEMAWVWYRSWDGSNSAERLTQGVIDGWRQQAPGG